MTENKLTKKEIKAQRVKNVFVDITRKIILEQGVEAVSVRKVADEAGYTVATIYNHFGHADALLAMTRDTIINDLVKYLTEKSKKLTGADSIKSVFKNYIDYCMEYPNAYHFLFFHHLKDVDKFTSTDALTELSLQFTSSFASLANSLDADVMKIAELGNAILFAVHGILTIYLSDNFSLTKAQVYEGLESVAKLILNNANLKGEKNR